ncbi:MAG TPA: glycosyltransferase [Burkholderiaceae bacterium]|nr:glycosyltransferase [Burkholderiaceae bacterium]
MNRLIVLCNAVDDVTRSLRRITTDSPAATVKVLGLARAIRTAGVRPVVLSLGRGRQDGSGQWHGWHVVRARGAAIAYAPFAHVPLLTYLLSLFAPALILVRLKRRSSGCTLVFYNRVPLYSITVLLARLMGMTVVLDLEDAPTHIGGRAIYDRVQRAVDRALDRLAQRALLACRDLGQSTRAVPTLVYYGSVPDAAEPDPAIGRPVVALLGGTLEKATGADLLVETVRRLREAGAPWTRELSIAVTGKGPGLELLQAAASDPRPPVIHCHGATSRQRYLEILAGASVGLSLKLSQGPYASTTFPSKVIELAHAGKLVITTDVSDVRSVLGDDGAVYLRGDSADELARALEQTVRDRSLAAQVAARGRMAVMEKCAEQSVGGRLNEFLFPAGARRARTHG